MKVSILGTGIMGTAVAQTLLRSEFEVTVWNRSPDRAKPLASDGARVATTPGDAVRGADVVLGILFDTAAVIDTMSAAVPDLPASAVWVQAATIGLDGSERVVGLAAQRGVSLVEAMMLGTKAPAQQGKLVLLTAGDRQLLDKLDPVFEAMASKVVVAGTEVGKATALKLVCNAWIASLTVATAQSLALAGGLNLDPRLFLEAITGGAVDSAYAQVKGEAMLTESFEPSFELDGALKDVRLIRDAAHVAGIDVSMLAAIESRFAAASSAGHGRDDMAAVIASIRPTGEVSRR